MKTKYFFIFLLFLITTLQALEIDEKLTLRIIRISTSKKTMLINRGIEDGLVVGDHAKFFITSGVIARGAVIKVSPSRSVWSLYRLTNPSEVQLDRVLKLKIATAVKVTDDASRMLIPDIPVKEGAEDRGSNVAGRNNLSGNDKSDLDSLRSEGDFTNIGGGLSTRTISLYGKLYVPSLSGSTTGDSETLAETSSLYFIFGIEKYFKDATSFLHDWSLGLFVHSSSFSVGTKYSSSVFEYGVSASWHFIEDPMSYGRIIGYFTGGIGIGMAKNDFERTEEDEGSVLFYYGGLGFKYMWKNGFGIRTVLDYYQRKEEFLIEDGSNYQHNYTGPRISTGLSFRF